MFENAKWIWTEENHRLGDRVLIRKRFLLEKPPKTALVRIAAADGYDLYVNGKLAVLLGGLPRESTPGNGYYDQLDIAKLLIKGENVLGFKVHYEGEKSDVAGAGLLVESPELGFVSDESFEAFRPAGYGYTAEPHPSGHLGGNILYDAGKDGEIERVFEPGFASTLFAPAKEYGSYPIPPWNELLPRAIPLFAFDGPIRLKKIVKTTVGATDTYEADLGEAVFAVPVLELFANGTERVEMKTDRYACPSGAQDTPAFLNRRIEYICKNGAQKVVGDIALSGTKWVICAPATVKISAISIYKSTFDAEALGSVWCDDAAMDALYKKSVHTLEQCMRENLIAAPDRERGVEMAALSVAARAALFVYGDQALPLIKKAIIDNAVFSPLCVKNYAGTPIEEESVLSSLIYLSEFGAVAAYYHYTGDEELLGKVHPLYARYLLSWQVGDDGFVLPRKAPEKAVDDAYNSDDTLIETCLYYSALKNLLSCALAANDTSCTDALGDRAETIAAAFENRFFKGEGYASGEYYDDRANALAVLCGLADSAHHAKLIRLLQSVNGSALQWEGFVVEALCRMGAYEAATIRLKSRMRGLIENDNPTLSETFLGGAPAYGGSVFPINLIFGALAGVCFKSGKSLTVSPALGGFNEIRFSVPVPGGTLRGQYKKESKNAVILDLNAPIDAQVLREGKYIKLIKGKSKYND